MSTAYPSPICTVDVVLLTLHNSRLHVALLKRDRAPFENALALPGGYVHAQEDRDTRDAAQRVLLTKAQLKQSYLEQLQTFSGSSRDPRGWSISVAYYALVPESALSAGFSAGLHLVDVDDLRGLAFDHKDIVLAAVARLRNKSQYSSLPAHLCPAEFTLPQLQAVYESVLGEPLVKASFRRKVDELDMVEAVVGAQESGKAHRPAQVYRLKEQFRQALALSGRPL